MTYTAHVFELQRPVRWGDVDAAGIVFFPRFLEYCHDAIEAMFAALDGGYAHLTVTRKIGVPTVHVAVDFRAPLRYGDVVRIEVSVLAIGRSSVTLRHRLVRAHDAILAAEVKQVIVVSDLVALKGVAIPDDVRRVLESHLAARDETPD